MHKLIPMCTEAVPCGEASSRYVIPSTYRGTEPKALSTMPTMNTDRYVLLSYTLSLAHLPGMITSAFQTNVYYSKFAIARP